MSKEEYETCRITNPNPRVIAVCNNPYKTMYFTITFRPFTPQPEGLEFLPGHDYYFISTSSKDDLHKRIGGRCTSNNMKVVFKVCCRNEADTSSSSATSRNNCEYSFFSSNNNNIYFYLLVKCNDLLQLQRVKWEVNQIPFTIVLKPILKSSNATNKNLCPTARKESFHMYDRYSNGSDYHNLKL